MGANAILIGVGMPQLLKLEMFGGLVWEAFGYIPYLVGSSLHGKTWRDVDIRLILPDDEYKVMFGSLEFGGSRLNGKWASVCMAYSALGKEFTGLPIDFQIQPQTKANEIYGGVEHARNAMGLHTSRIARHVEPIE